MEYRNLELRVGFTIFIAVLVFTIGLMWFEGFDVGRKTYELHAVFPMVGGIDPGDAVSVNGVEKGEVRRVELRERDVILTMSIDVAARIPEDSRVILQTRGIMGERIVSIILGESEAYLEEGAMLQGVYDSGISEALAATGQVMDKLTTLVDDIGELTDLLTEEGRLKETVRNLAEITEELKKGIGRNMGLMDNGMTAFSRSTERVDSLLARNTARVDSVLYRLDDVSRELPALFDKIGEVTDSLGEIAKRLESNDSTLGALVQDRQLLDKLEKAIKGLDELVTDIKKNPKKYLKIEIF